MYIHVVRSRLELNIGTRSWQVSTLHHLNGFLCLRLVSTIACFQFSYAKIVKVPKFAVVICLCFDFVSTYMLLKLFCSSKRVFYLGLFKSGYAAKGLINLDFT
jgi:hypothetical protein